MKRLSRGERKHEETVGWLVDRLLSPGKFDWINTDLHYSVGEDHGQVDVLACISSSPTHFYFYEVKCSFSRKNLAKAREQYERYKRSFPNVSLEGYLVTKGRIERLDT